MSASRFIEGVNAQSQSIMEWVEKRLKLSESGVSAFNSSSTSPLKPRIFVKGVLKQPGEAVAGPSSNTSTPNNSPEKISGAALRLESRAEINVDDDGWQIYDPAQFEAAATSAGTPDEEIPDSGVISSIAFNELPADIREELAHFHKLDQAKRLKEATSEREKKKILSKKRLTTTIVKSSPAKKKKKIDAFFRKN